MGILAAAAKKKGRSNSAVIGSEVSYSAVIDRSSFFMLLQDQKLLQNQKQDLLPVSEAPVKAEAPV